MPPPLPHANPRDLPPPPSVGRQTDVEQTIEERVGRLDPHCSKEAQTARSLASFRLCRAKYSTLNCSSRIVYDFCELSRSFFVALVLSYKFFSAAVWLQCRTTQWADEEEARSCVRVTRLPSSFSVRRYGDAGHGSFTPKHMMRHARRGRGRTHWRSKRVNGLSTMVITTAAAPTFRPKSLSECFGRSAWSVAVWRYGPGGTFAQQYVNRVNRAHAKKPRDNVSDVSAGMGACKERGPSRAPGHIYMEWRGRGGRRVRGWVKG